jgi:hypothetical protein
VNKAFDQDLHDVRTKFQYPLLASLLGDPRWQVLIERAERSAEQLAAIRFEVARFPPRYDVKWRSARGAGA